MGKAITIMFVFQIVFTSHIMYAFEIMFTFEMDMGSVFSKALFDRNAACHNALLRYAERN
ncbi:hypothetical protein D3C84_1047730 [compost metagenome]